MFPFGGVALPVVEGVAGFELMTFYTSFTIDGDAAADAGADSKIDGFTGDTFGFKGGGDGGVIIYSDGKAVG